MILPINLMTVNPINNIILSIANKYNLVIPQHIDSSYQKLSRSACKHLLVCVIVIYSFFNSAN